MQFDGFMINSFTQVMETRCPSVGDDDQRCWSGLVEVDNGIISPKLYVCLKCRSVYRIGFVQVPDDRMNDKAALMTEADRISKIPHSQSSIRRAKEILGLPVNNPPSELTTEAALRKAGFKLAVYPVFFLNDLQVDLGKKSAAINGTAIRFPETCDDLHALVAALGLNAKVTT